MVLIIADALITVALSRASLTVAAGECVALVGGNGAGKSFVLVGAGNQLDGVASLLSASRGSSAGWE